MRSFSLVSSLGHMPFRVSMLVTCLSMALCQIQASPRLLLKDPSINFSVVFPTKGQQINKAKEGEFIFSDRKHIFKKLPSFLKNKSYVFSGMNAECRIVPVTEGTILVVTPRIGQSGSQEKALTEDGFTLMDYPSFSLYEEQDGEVGVFKKDIEYHKFRLPEVRHGGWAVAFFETETLPSISIAAEILWNPDTTYTKNARLWQGCPSIDKTGKRLWSAWFSGGAREPDAGNYGIVSYSDDGTSWIDPAMVIVHSDSNVRVMDPQLWTDPKGRLWVFWVQNTGQKGFDGIWGTWAIRIDNPEADKPAWTSPRRLSDGLTRCKPIVLSSGEWLLPSYDWINHQTAVYISYDQGESWSMQGGPINPAVSNFYEHMCVELADGNIWMLQRNIQQSFSKNKGADWTPLDTIADIHAANSRLYIGRLRSGNLLLVYNDDPKKRKNLTAFLSKDDGKTWSHKLLLDDRNEVSYPDVVQDEHGLIYVCYDRSRRGEKEILMTVFLESDIESGKFVSDEVKQRSIISKVKKP